jgi:hypothetical protein
MPSPVDKYHEQIKKDNPGYSDEQAWATAWSVYCKHKNPGSPHCHKPPSEYLKGKSASVIFREFEDAVLIRRVASRFATALPEEVEEKLLAWRREKDQILDAVSTDLADVDNLIHDFKGIETRVRDREQRKLITDDVHAVDSLMQVVETFGDLGVIL